MFKTEKKLNSEEKEKQTLFCEKFAEGLVVGVFQALRKVPEEEKGEASTIAANFTAKVFAGCTQTLFASSQTPTLRTEFIAGLGKGIFRELWQASEEEKESTLTLAVDYTVKVLVGYPNTLFTTPSNLPPVSIIPSSDSDSNDTKSVSNLSSSLLSTQLNSG